MASKRVVRTLQSNVKGASVVQPWIVLESRKYEKK
jgi:hypothetical protein